MLEGDELRLVVGSTGGSTIFTSVYQVILNAFDFAMPLQAAVDSTRFHHQLPQHLEIRYDRGRDIPARARRELEAMGYQLNPNWWGRIGDIQAIAQDAAGKVTAASDVRGRGKALVLP